MASQLEHLRRSLAEMDARGVSADNAMRQGIIAQIALHERNAWRKANGGWWGPNAAFLEMPCGRGRKR
jgi:hypothetical protein